MLGFLRWLLKLISFHPETQIFLLPLDGGGQGGGDKDLKSQIFIISSPSPQPSPAGGEGVPGWNLIRELGKDWVCQ